MIMTSLMLIHGVAGAVLCDVPDRVFAVIYPQYITIFNNVPSTPSRLGDDVPEAYTIWWKGNAPPMIHA